ncbi:MAG: hypothetical protein RR101_15400, partial [Burkholderiaceae bacterium]
MAGRPFKHDEALAAKTRELNQLERALIAAGKANVQASRGAAKKTDENATAEVNEPGAPYTRPHGKRGDVFGYPAGLDASAAGSPAVDRDMDPARAISVSGEAPRGSLATRTRLVEEARRDLGAARIQSAADL